jgi:hypothetical protein
MDPRYSKGERERRKASRSPILHFTGFQVSREGRWDDSIQGEAFIVNISEAGACLFLDKGVEPEMLIRFYLPPPYAKSGKWSLAEIKWIRNVPWDGGCFAGSVFVS